MPVVVACLAPAAPALLPHLTGSQVPELGPVRAAVAAAVDAMAGADRVVVVAAGSGGTLAGFGAPAGAVVGGGTPEPGGAVPGSRTAADRAVGWEHELAGRLLGAGPGPLRPRARSTWDELAGVPQRSAWLAGVQALPGRTALLLLADGSRTRGPRAPGGDDLRGRAVDEELVAALREGRSPVAPDADRVGATAVAAVALLAQLGGRTQVLHEEAPLGVTYLVAVCRAATP